MVTKYRNPKKVSVKDYLANKENSGRVAVFDPAIVAEGDGTDWVELELMYESLREQGDYELVIVRGYEPTVTRFERLPV